jgi:hypothetical protein
MPKATIPVLDPISTEKTKRHREIRSQHMQEAQRRLVDFPNQELEELNKTTRVIFNGRYLA